MHELTKYLGSDPTLFMGNLAESIHNISSSHGFWPKDGRNFGEMIALAHSELSEALEAHRGGEAPYWEAHEKACTDMEICACIPKPEGAAVELVDCIIRCLDTLYSMNVDIDGVLLKKMMYNDSRPYKHGKAY